MINEVAKSMYRVGLHKIKKVELCHQEWQELLAEIWALRQAAGQPLLVQGQAFLFLGLPVYCYELT